MTKEACVSRIATYFSLFCFFFFSLSDPLYFVPSLLRKLAHTHAHAWRWRMKSEKKTISTAMMIVKIVGILYERNRLTWYLQYQRFKLRFISFAIDFSMCCCAGRACVLCMIMSRPKPNVTYIYLYI